MLRRMFGTSRRPVEIGQEAEDRDPYAWGDDYVVVDKDDSSAPADTDSNYTLSGATAFKHTDVARTVSSPDDPLDGVPFQLTVSMSEVTTTCTDLSRAMSVLAKMETTDWDAFEYNFKLERSVIDECNSKLQTAMMSFVAENET